MDHKNIKEKILREIEPKEGEKGPAKKEYDQGFNPFISDEADPELYPNSYYKWVKDGKNGAPEIKIKL